MPDTHDICRPTGKFPKREYILTIALAKNSRYSSKGSRLCSEIANNKFIVTSCYKCFLCLSNTLRAVLRMFLFLRECIPSLKMNYANNNHAPNLVRSIKVMYPCSKDGKMIIWWLRFQLSHRFPLHLKVLQVLLRNRLAKYNFVGRTSVHNNSHDKNKKKKKNNGDCL